MTEMHPLLQRAYDAAGFAAERAEIDAAYEAEVARINREAKGWDPQRRAQAVSVAAWHRQSQRLALQARERAWWTDSSDDISALVLDRARDLLEEVEELLSGTDGQARPIRGLRDIAQELSTLVNEQITPVMVVHRAMTTRDLLCDPEQSALPLGTVRPADGLQLQDGRPGSVLRAQPAQPAAQPVVTLIHQRHSMVRQVEAEEISRDDGPLDVA